MPRLKSKYLLAVAMVGTLSYSSFVHAIFQTAMPTPHDCNIPKQVAAFHRQEIYVYLLALVVVAAFPILLVYKKRFNPKFSLMFPYAIMIVFGIAVLLGFISLWGHRPPVSCI